MKNKYKTCTILWLIAAVCEFLSGTFNIFSNGFSIQSFSNIGLGICFISLAILYSEKEKK